jgi:hypothetical protein
LIKSYFSIFFLTLLDWYEKEFGVILGIRFDEEDGCNTNFDDVIDAIRNS